MPVLVGQQWPLAIFQWPADGQIRVIPAKQVRVIPAKRALMLRRPAIGSLINEHRCCWQGEKAVCESRRNPYRPFVFIIQAQAVLLPERG